MTNSKENIINMVKPEKKKISITVTRVVTYWACAIEKHQHRSRETAELYIEKSARPKRETNHWTKESYAAVLALRRQGMTNVEIGKQYGVSGSRIYGVICKALQIEQRQQFKNRIIVL